MQITYQVEDGYVGGQRPRTVNINDSDLEYCETKEEWEDIINECVEEDFRQNCYPVFQMPKWPGNKEQTKEN